MARALGVGIVGCGNISETYLKLAPLFRGIEMRACADIDMAAKYRRALAPFAHAQRDLLHDQAVDANDSLRMNDNAVRMRDHQPAADFGVKRNVGARDGGPEAMAKHDERTAQPSERARKALVIANRFQKLSPRVPEAAGGLARPVGRLRKVGHLKILAGVVRAAPVTFILA